LLLRLLLLLWCECGRHGLLKGRRASKLFVLGHQLLVLAQVTVGGDRVVGVVVMVAAPATTT
jgi:hypothetical protein